jgi:tetratricopeptide (TPR) repeat protein
LNLFHAAPLRRCLLAGLLLGLAASSAQAAAVYSDEIYLRGKDQDKPTVAQITKDTVTEIKTADGAAFNPKAVVRIKYSGAPQSFRNAEAHRETGRYEEAITNYEATLRNLKPDDERKFWIEPHCRFYLAECYAEIGDVAKAEAAYNDLLTKHPDTRFKPDALLGLGRVNFEAKKYDIASRRFDDLEQFAKQLDWPEWLYEAQVWKARSSRMEKRYDVALEQARKVVATADPRKFEDAINQARTEEALVYVAQEQYDKAIDLLSKQLDRISALVAREIEAGGSTRAQHMEAQCKNALGHCYLQRFAKSQKKEDLQEALIAYLWTVTLYPNLAERADALKSAAECFEKLGDKERAGELRDELSGKEAKEPKDEKAAKDSK